MLLWCDGRDHCQIIRMWINNNTIVISFLIYQLSC